MAESIVSQVEYRDIAGWSGYRVGSDGTIWSKRQRGWAGSQGWKQLTTWTHRGYHKIDLWNNRKKASLFVHRLVLLAFAGECPLGYQACHNDGNKGNNSIGNLRWDTVQSNHDDMAKHGTRARGERQGQAKLTEEKVRAIRRRRDEGATNREVGAEFGIGLMHVSKIYRKVIWSHVT